MRIIARLNRGGPARCVINLASRLRGEGFDTLVVAGRPEPGEGDMAPELETEGAALETIPCLGSRIHPWNDVRALKALRNIVCKYKPHIIHTHTAKAGFLGRLAAGAVRPAPVRVHTFHGHVLDSYFGPVWSFVFRWLEKRAAQSTDAFVAVSPSVRDELVERHGIGHFDQYLIAPSGRPEEPASRGASLRCELGLGRSLVVGWVGRLVPVKDVQTFLDAVPLVLKAMPDVKFLIAGDGRLRSHVEQTLTRSPWKDNVIFTGMRADVENLYATMDILALTSLKEGLPTVLVEAAMAKVPVAASRIPGVTDLFEDQREAALFEPGSSAGLAAALSSIASDESPRKTMADRAFDRVMEQVPDFASVARKHAVLYNALLKRQG